MDPLFILFIGMAVVIGGILLLRLPAFLALLAGAFIVGSIESKTAIESFAREQGLTLEEAQNVYTRDSVGNRVAFRLGDTCRKIVIIIAMAAIIGKCLLDSGAADRVVRSALKFFGQERAPIAFTSSGFLLAIPVFFDTVFYLLIPLGKALGLRDPKRYSFFVMTIAAGASMAHSLVPPTPGPLLVASELNVNIGSMMLGGLFVGLFACIGGYWFAKWANKHWPAPLRETPDMSLADLEAISKRDDHELPPLWLSLLPILLPVILIAGDAILKSIYTDASPSAGWWAGVVSVFAVFGNKNVALVIAAAIALVILGCFQRTKSENFFKAIEPALASGGVIILITAAGGAFGGVLQETGIGTRIEGLATTYNIAVLPLAFLVTALVRIAQGSATVAMITAVGIFSGMATGEQLGFHPLYVALAIGCGSKPYPWMNDSGFWVVCKMSGLTEAEMLKTYSMMIAMMGFVGLFVVMILARVYPMI